MTIMVPRRGHRRPAPLLLAALVLLAAACGGADDGSPPAAAAGRSPHASATGGAGAADAGATTGATRILFLGDSITAGYGLAEVDAFPRLVESELRERGYAVEVINAGVSGDTSAGGLSRMDWVLRSEPDIVVVELGANDALRGQPVAATEENLRRIVRRAREAGARVLLLGMDIPTNYGPDYTAAFSGMYGRVASDLDVALVPEFVREVGSDPRLMQPDGLHPTAEGHRRLADAVLPAIETLLR